MTATAAQPTKPSSRTMPLVIAILILALLSAGATVWYFYFQTYHLLTVQDGVLYRTGNRGLREFKNSLRASHAKTVVCVVDDNELVDPAKPMFLAEKQYLQDNNITFIHLPVTLGGWPSTEDIRQFLTLTEDKSKQPVLVHCAQGVRRTGMFVAAYEKSVLKWDDAKTLAHMQSFGHSARTTSDIAKFISIYDGPSRSITTTLAPTGQE
ncbi:MAG TPA: tyrosine-protein phosphatase [Tepidisphaeraceae bacterium]|jgi:protein tyrosine phosphatase (PTP) superfamily phosphohydrolase (DUF442 family)|nr:tyrosine-protein phosphatase [Tepidisphaeraceae bacterium]